MRNDTLMRLLADGAQRLRGVVDDPKREAEVLLADALGLEDRLDLVTGDVTVSAESRRRYDASLAARASGVPRQYVVGYADFYEDRFVVGPGVFIPRPETELLVEAVVDAWPDRGRGGLIVEVGTGSGAVVVSLLRALPVARAIGIDRSSVAARTTRANAQRLGVIDRLAIIVGDGLSALDVRNADVLVSNPPYVATDETLPPIVHDHEPHLALYAGTDGLKVVKTLVRAAPGVLRAGGLCAFEIGAAQGRSATDVVRGEPELSFLECRRDLAGLDRVVLATRR